MGMVWEKQRQQAQSQFVRSSLLSVMILLHCEDPVYRLQGIDTPLAILQPIPSTGILALSVPADPSRSALSRGHLAQAQLIRPVSACGAGTVAHHP